MAVLKNQRCGHLRRNIRTEAEKNCYEMAKLLETIKKNEDTDDEGLCE
jgi:hypothetical protein